MVRIAKQLRQGGAGPGRDEIEGLELRVFHPPVSYLDLQLHHFCGGSQKGAFFGSGFV